MDDRIPTKRELIDSEIRRIPLLDRLEPPAAAGPRRGERSGGGVLRPADQCAGGEWHRALGDAVSLGPAAGVAAGAGRAAQSGDCGPFCPLRGIVLCTVRRPGETLDHAQ